MSKNTTLTVGAVIELETTSIAHGGVSIGRYDGRVVFVHDSLPGEKILAEVIEVKKSFARAVTKTLLQPAPERVEHIWPEAAVHREPAIRAGGADFGHIALAHQRFLKQQVLTDALNRQGKITAENMPDFTINALAGDEVDGGYGWRTRVRLHVDEKTGKVGPYAARSRNVVPVTSLPLATEELSLIAPLEEIMPDVQHVDLVSPSADDARMLINYRGEKTAVGAEDIVRERVFDTEFQVRAGGFWQVHKGAAEALFAEVSGAITSLDSRLDPQAENLDLYGGVGLLAAAFIDAAGPKTRITSIESVESATDLAAENLSIHTGAKALTARTEDYLAALINGSALTLSRIRKATFVADPPRTGLGSKVCAQIAQLQPANLLYVACDPVAFARDTQLLQTAGYTLLEVHGLDMFPHTHHFETIGLFTRG